MAQEHLQSSTSFLDSATLRLVKHMFMAYLSQMEVIEHKLGAAMRLVQADPCLIRASKYSRTHMSSNVDQI